MFLVGCEFLIIPRFVRIYSLFSVAHFAPVCRLPTQFVIQLNNFYAGIEGGLYVNISVQKNENDF